MITIENINGKDYTVVWHRGAPLQVMRLDEHDSSRIPIQNASLQWLANGSAVWMFDTHVATALPALLRYPKNDEATIRLLHLYRAHGLVVMRTDAEGFEWLVDGAFPEHAPVTHATFNGERVEIAREENE